MNLLVNLKIYRIKWKVEFKDGSNNTKTVNVIADTFSEVTDRLRKLYNSYESGWTYDDIISVVKIDLEGEII